MATIKELFGAGGQTITITLTSLANGAARASAAIDNTSALYLDALVVLKAIKAGATPSSTGTVSVYAYGGVDGTSPTTATYPEGITGADAAVTLNSPPNLRLIGLLNVNAGTGATTFTSPPLSVAAAFGGTLPQYWGLVIVNNSGAALDATTPGTILYQGVQAQSV